MGAGDGRSVQQLFSDLLCYLGTWSLFLEMSLNPESLGKVNLNITSKDGVMTAQITTQNEVSKEALESQLQILKDNIEVDTGSGVLKLKRVG